MPSSAASNAATVALVGDRSPHVRAHTRIPAILESLRQRDGIGLDACWVRTDEALDTDLDRFDGVWLLPGSPYRSAAGALAASRVAREQGIPFLGTCGGFQHALLDFARTVCGLGDAEHAETAPEADDLLIVALACSLVGHEGAVNITSGSLAERVIGVERTIERYHCAYGVNPARLDVLRSYGMRFTGHDDNGDVRIAELADHPFYLATLFQPELADTAERSHPIIRAFAAAAVDHAGVRLAG